MATRFKVPFSIRGVEDGENIILEADSVYIKEIKTRHEKNNLFVVTVNYGFKNLRIVENNAPHVRYRLSKHKNGLKYFIKENSSFWFTVTLRKTAFYASLEEFDLEDFEDEKFDKGIEKVL